MTGTKIMRTFVKNQAAYFFASPFKKEREHDHGWGFFGVVRKENPPEDPFFAAIS